MLHLYNAALWPARAAAVVWALWPGDADRRREVAQRLGRELPRARPGGIWLHGASMGEARIVATLTARLAADAPDPPPLSVSATTRTGRAPPRAARPRRLPRSR